MEVKLQVAILRSSDEQLEELVRVVDNYLAHIVGDDPEDAAKLRRLRAAAIAEQDYRRRVDLEDLGTGRR